MKLGLSTYSFYWHLSRENPKPLTLEQLLELTKNYDLNVFQICDFEPLERMSTTELERIASKARQLNIELEVGTRGIHPTKLLRFFDICERLNSKTLRTMLNCNEFTPSYEEAVLWLKEIAPRVKEKGIAIAIETYEQRKTEEIVSIIKEVGSESIGICLDPANCIANLEVPQQVIKLATPYVKNLHLKDFTFERKKGWVGFSLIGTPFGEGKLDNQFLIDCLTQKDIDVNAIIEFWLPFTNSIEETLMTERQWIEKSISSIKNQWRDLK